MPACSHYLLSLHALARFPPPLPPSLPLPSEDGTLEARERKVWRYEPLLREIVSNGYSCSLFPVVVGCRGKYTDSLRSCLLELGLSKAGDHFYLR